MQSIWSKTPKDNSIWWAWASRYQDFFFFFCHFLLKLCNFCGERGHVSSSFPARHGSRHILKPPFHLVVLQEYLCQIHKVVRICYHHCPELSAKSGPPSLVLPRGVESRHPPDPREDFPLTWRILNIIELDPFYFCALILSSLFNSSLAKLPATSAPTARTHTRMHAAWWLVKDVF